MKITIHRHESNNSYLVKLAGEMNHQTLDALHELAEYEDIQKCIFDFKDVVHFELCGVMQWLNFTYDFFSNKEVIYQNCRTQWLMLIRQIPQIMNHVTLDSIIAEYVCHECDDFSEETISADDHSEYLNDPENKEKRCESCFSGSIDIIENEQDLFFFFTAA